MFSKTYKYLIYDSDKTSYNINIKHAKKILIFWTFQQPHNY